MEMPLSGFLFAGGLELAVPLLVSRQSSSPRVGVKTADDWLIWHICHKVITNIHILNMCASDPRYINLMIILSSLGIFRITMPEIPANLQRWCQHLSMLRAQIAVRLVGLCLQQTYQQAVKMENPQYHQPTVGLANLQHYHPQMFHHNRRQCQCCRYHLRYVHKKLICYELDVFNVLKPKILWCNV